MAQVVAGRYTARMDEPVAVFINRDLASPSQSPCGHRPPDDPGEVYRGSSQHTYCSTRLGDYAHGPDRARR
jgi:hypothetical protein